ncbi:unnamed protein product, partial [Sphagnum balticum]
MTDNFWFPETKEANSSSTIGKHQKVIECWTDTLAHASGWSGTPTSQPLSSAADGRE